MTVTVLAEKPSVARDIAAVLGARSQRRGFLEGNGFVVTWALGHLVELSEPHEIEAGWKRWRVESLPMIPRKWPLRIAQRTADQFEIVRAQLQRADVGSIVCATDAGREGELIFRYIMEAAGCRKPVRRLWISSLTPDAIRRGFASLRDARDFDGLAAAARGRSQADWLVGMNASRAYTLAMGDTLSVGRVQTPTLAMIVERELAIRNFVPERYTEVVAQFSPKTKASGQGYEGIYFDPAQTKKSTSAESRPPDANAAKDEESSGRDLDQRLPADGKLAQAIAKRAQTGTATVARRETRERTIPAPRLHDLTDLQRQANRLFGFSAQRTLDLAQALYERHKLISYPRTESRYLDADVAASLPAIVDAIAGPYQADLAPGTGSAGLGPRFVDASRVSDHHAIVPTTRRAPATLARDEARIYDLVCRRLLAAWHADHRYGATVLITTISGPSSDTQSPDFVDHYRSRGTQVIDEGWKVIESPPRKSATTAKSAKTKAGARPDLPPGLERGDPVAVNDARAVDRETKPPRRYDDARLLSAMENAGRSLDDRELERAMAGSGLGTPATRASIIETLLRREYVARKAKIIEATDKGIKLIETVHAPVKSPEMTARWEYELQALEHGRGSLRAFMAEIEQYVHELVGRASGGTATRATHEQSPQRTQAARTHTQTIAAATPTAGASAGAAAGSSSRSSTAAAAATPRSSRVEPSTVPTVESSSSLPKARHPACAKLTAQQVLAQYFGYPKFRAHQQEICENTIRGEHSLVVMPTGAGKSLCYQLPGLARGGTTLVVSPLIALIEDQVASLRERDLAAERIHSGRGREASRAACRAYLDGGLDFLFIAPERLGVPGFPEMLAKRRPGLIAIDEAHCISQWGHDFRPDYRMLRERLALLEPTPITALTATATPRVQRDIAERLGIDGATTFIRGFRRDNIAIEVVELPVRDRPAALRELLQASSARPAIVYAPSRKQTEALAEQLVGTAKAAPYHAGLPAPERARIQAQFAADEIDVVVATIAFGMGIDKADVRTVIHAAMPSSIENYYQEIGRAGRDGKPSRAVLLHGFADRKTQEFLLRRNYPDIDEVERVFQRLSKTPIARSQLAAQLGLEDDELEQRLDKLWVNAGASIDANDAVTRGSRRWRKTYSRQIDHVHAQLDKVQKFVESSKCRMQSLVSHFGDRADARRKCGHCDVCAPGESRLVQLRPPTSRECQIMIEILEFVDQRQGLGSARVHRELFAETLSRDRFEEFLHALVRADLIELSEESFESEGKTIHYKALRVPALEHARTRVPELQLTQCKVGGGEACAVEPRKSASKPAKPTTRKRSTQRASSRPTTSSPAAVESIAQALSQWRTNMAQRHGLPPFRVLSNRVLDELARTAPTNLSDLAEVRGMGPKSVERYGRSLLLAIRKAAGS